MEIQDVENLAELAKLELTDVEKAQILKDMEGILAYVKVIEDVEVPEIEPEYLHRNMWREDVIEEMGDYNRDLIMQQFPDRQDNFVKVKKIL